MTLNEKIYAKTQQPTYRATVNGSIELIQVESIQIENDFDRSSASATITCAAKRNINPNDEIIIYQGYAGFMVRTFTGYIDDVDKEAFPNKFVIAARDVLKRAIDNYLVDEVEYDSVQAEDAVKDLLEKSGIYNYSLDTTNFTIGDVNPAKFSLISAMDAIKAIADLIGWRIWATKGGTVKFAKVYSTPSISYRWLYTKDPTFGSQSGIVRVTHSFTDINLRNWVEVWGWTNPETGDTIKAIRNADSPFVPSPPRYRKCVVSSEIIDTQPMADWIAERILNDLNCLLERGEIEIQGNPTLNVGDTIRITEDWTDQSSGVNYFIYGLSSRMDGSGDYSMSLQIRGGKAAPPYTEGEPPIADLIVSQVGWGDPTWVVYVDASNSYDPDGTIVSYDIDWGDATAHATTIRANHIYAGGAGTQYTITLTVTDDDGLTGTCSKTITLGQTDGGSVVYNRVLYFTTDNGAGGGLCFGSPDSGNIWYSYNPSSPVNCVSVQDNVEEGYAWFGCTNGKVYKTNDYCNTATLVYTFGAAVRSIWIDRVYKDVILVGLSDGKIYRTIDGGTTWILLYTFAEGPIWNVFCEPGDIEHIHCNGGTTAGYWQESIDGGESWVNLAAGWSGIETIRDSAWQFWQYLNAACQTDAGSIRRSEDDGATWVTCSGYTETLMRTISASPFDPEVVVAGGESAKTVWRTLTGDSYSAAGLVVNGTKVTRLRFDGDLWGTIHGGTDDDLELSFNTGETWKQLKDVTGTVMDIAQGPLIKDIGIRGIWSYGSDGNVYHSSNGGKSWVKFATSGLSNFGGFFRIVGHSIDLKTAYMTSYDSADTIIRVWKTIDGNISWNQVGTIDGGWAYAKVLTIDPINPDILWCGVQSTSETTFYIYKSIDGGVNWNSKYTSSGNMDAIACSPVTANRVVFAVEQGPEPRFKIYVSINGGDSWTLKGSQTGVLFENLRRGGMGFSPNGQRVVFHGGGDHPITGGGARVAVSTDAGSTWSWSAPDTPREINCNQDYPNFATVGMNSHTMFVSSTGPPTSGTAKAYISNDVGSTWTEIFSAGGRAFVKADPMVTETIWAISYNAFYRSDDDGTTWKLVSNPGGIYPNDLSFSGFIQQTIY